MYLEIRIHFLWLKFFLNVQLMTGRLQITYRYGSLMATTSLSSPDYYLPGPVHSHTAVAVQEEVESCFVHIGETHLVQECWHALDVLGRTKVVKHKWVHGHIGVEGNKRTDERTKHGSSTLP